MSEPKLEACPNRECRSEALTEHLTWYEHKAYDAFVECEGCQMRGPRCGVWKQADEVYAAAKAEARRLWNALPRDNAPGDML